MSTLSIEDLAYLLAVDAKRVRQWLADGLPWHQPPRARGRRALKRYDPATCWLDEDEVIEWLLGRGIIEERPARLFETQREVAAFFGVSDKTIQTWINLLGAPGKNDEGYYDCDAIAAWQEQRHLRTAKGSATAETRAKHEAEIARLKKERMQRELDELDGRLVAIAEPLAWNRRQVAEWRSRMLDLAEIMLSLIPATVRAPWKKNLRRRVREEVEAACQEFAEALTSWAQGLEEEPRADESRTADGD